MSKEISTTSVTVYEARRDGCPLGFELDRDSLIAAFKIRPDSRRTVVEVSEQVVGVVDGELVDWNAGHPGSPRVKLHWTCPRCGLQQWGDWSSAMPNPCLWGSDCPCIDKWLIHWQLEDSGS